MGKHPAKLLQIQGSKVGEQVAAAPAQPLRNGLGQAALALQGKRLPHRRPQPPQRRAGEIRAL